MLLPRQRLKLARGAKDKEHAMSQNPNSAVDVIGIDIGKNSFHVVGLILAARLCCGRSGARPG
jgi:transposase